MSSIKLEKNKVSIIQQQRSVLIFLNGNSKMQIGWYDMQTGDLHIDEKHNNTHFQLTQICYNNRIVAVFAVPVPNPFV